MARWCPHCNRPKESHPRIGNKRICELVTARTLDDEGSPTSVIVHISRTKAGVLVDSTGKPTMKRKKM